MPECRLYHSTTQTLPHNTATLIQFDTEALDPDGMHDPGTPGRVTFREQGVWAVAFVDNLAPANDYRLIEQWRSLNGVASVPGSTGRAENPDGTAVFPQYPSHDIVRPTSWGFRFMYDIAVGDWVEFYMRQRNDAAAARTLTSVAVHCLWLCSTKDEFRALVRGGLGDKPWVDDHLWTGPTWTVADIRALDWSRWDNVAAHP